MFTGLIEEVGTVARVESTPSGHTLFIDVGSRARGLRKGDSLAVNGCCLTVARLTGRAARFELLEETWQRTNLRFCTPKSRVNLELALRAGSRLGGHFVTGHIDATGRITRWEKSGADHVLEISSPASIARHLIPKGSIAVDGISLTLAETTPRGFRVWIIPHTLAATNLATRQVGDLVNLESDLRAKSR
jgi:riboflavin synthase